MSGRKVEVTSKMATMVDSLDQAWVFVMSVLDEMGPDPQMASAGKGEEYLHRIDVLEADLAEAERLLADLLAWKKPGEDGRTRYEGDPPWQARAFLDRKNRT